MWCLWSRKFVRWASGMFTICVHLAHQFISSAGMFYILMELTAPLYDDWQNWKCSEAMISSIVSGFRCSCRLKATERCYFRWHVWIVIFRLTTGCDFEYKHNGSLISIAWSETLHHCIHIFKDIERQIARMMHWNNNGWDWTWTLPPSYITMYDWLR